VHANRRSRAHQPSQPCDGDFIRASNREKNGKSESRARSPNSDSRAKKKCSPPGEFPAAGERQKRVPESGGGGRGAAAQPAVALDEAFDRFWAAYPRRIAKERARKAFAKAVENGADPTTLIEGARRYAAKRSAEIRDGDPPKFTLHPATWLNDGCWTDEPDNNTAPVIDQDGNPVEDERPKRDPIIEEAFSMLAPSVRSGR
jgi:hypothetical protein